MAIFDRIRRGSFKGAPFLVISASTSGGRKQVKHEFPNSPLQSIEDLGFMPKSFSLVVETTTDLSPDGINEDSYFTNRDNLIAALDEGGRGILSHPFFASDLVVVARPYSYDESFSELGVARFNLLFEPSDLAVNPRPSRSSLSAINNQVNIVTDQIGDDITDNWSVSTGFNVREGVSLVEDFLEDVRDNTQRLVQTTDNINQFNSDLSSLQSDIVAIVQVPQQLSNSIINIVQNTRGLYASVSSALEVFTRFFGFGDALDAVLGTTKNREEQRINQNIFITSVQAAYLAQAYQSAAVTNYTTVEEVDNTKAILEDEFNKLMNNEISNDLREPLSLLRTQANLFLDNQRLSAPQILDVSTFERPLRALAFDYYGEDNGDTTQTLIDLNNVVDPSFIEGDIRVISS